MPSKISSKSSIGLKTLDFLGSEFSFCFPTITGKFQTHFGGSITILLGIVTALTFVVVMSQYFDKTGPIVTTSSELGSRLMEFNLYDQLMFSPMGMYVGPAYVQGNWSKYVTIKARVDRSVYNTTTQIFQTRPYLEFDFIPCSESKDPAVIKLLEGLNDVEKIISIFICPDFRGLGQEYTAIDDFEKYQFQWINVHVYPCSLENKEECASEEEIRQLTVDVNPITKLLKTSDYKDPLRNFILRRYVEVEPSVKKIVKFDMRNSKVVDDASRFFPPVVKEEFSSAFMSSFDFKERDRNQFHCDMEVIKQGPHAGCSPYITYNYAGVGDIGIIRRNYKKWTEMLGEFGGIMKVIGSTVFFLYAFYNSFAMKGYLSKIILGSKAEELAKKEKGAKSSTNIEPGKTSAEKKKQRKIQKEALKKLLNSRICIDDLISKLNTLDLIERVLFEGDEDLRDLIPLALFKKTQKEVEEQKDNKKISEKKHGKNDSKNHQKQHFSNFSDNSKKNLFKIKKNQILPDLPNKERNREESGPGDNKYSYNLEIQSKTALSDSFKASVKEYILRCLEEEKGVKMDEKPVDEEDVVQMNQINQDSEIIHLKTRKTREIDLQVYETKNNQKSPLEACETPLTGYSSVRELKDSRRSLSIVKKRSKSPMKSPHRKRHRLSMMKKRGSFSKLESSRLKNFINNTSNGGSRSRPSLFMSRKISSLKNQQ